MICFSVEIIRPATGWRGDYAVDSENRRLTGGGRVFAGVPGIGCSGGKSGSAAKSGAALATYTVFMVIAWREDWTTGWAGDELGGRTGDLSGGGGTGHNRVITDVAIKNGLGTRPEGRLIILKLTE